MSTATKGVIAGLGAFLLWGVFPVFWKELQHIPASQILLHRIWWSAVFLYLLLKLRERSQGIALPQFSQKSLAWFCLTASLIACNWLLYIWAVNAGYVLETSLGYFINPLLSVFLGFVVLKEQLSKSKFVAIAIAFSSVLFLTLQYGSFPFIAMGLALSFGLYALFRKLATVGSLEGLYLESILLAPLSLIGIIVLEFRGESFLFSSFFDFFMLVLTGPATAIPLLLFAYAARAVKLSTVGLMQYIAPTIQFLLAVFLYKETFTSAHAWAFAGIWTALLIYTADNTFSLQRSRKSRVAAGQRG